MDPQSEPAAAPEPARTDELGDDLIGEPADEPTHAPTHLPTGANKPIDDPAAARDADRPTRDPADTPAYDLTGNPERTGARDAKSADVPGVTLPTLDLGHGPDLVFLPGLDLTHERPRGLSRATTTAMLAQLTRSHRVHWLGRREGVPDGFTIDDFAQDCADNLRSRFDRPVPVLGFSTGGFVALSLAIGHPELVERLVVVGAGARLTARTRAVEQRWIDNVAHGRVGAGWWQLGADLADPGGAARAVTAALGRIGPRATPTQARDSAATARADVAFDATDRLAGIQAPTLLVVGGRDTAVDPDLAALTRDGIAGAQLLELAHTGHVGSLLHPRTTAGIRRFLAGDPI